MLCLADECNIVGICISYQTKTKIDMAKKEGIRKLFDNIAPDYDRLPKEGTGVWVRENKMAFPFVNYCIGR